ncbi:hypothetical protein [Rhodoferax sp.]|uniref:hypothetical protein n=1 Tax=Rhodoferax sp. TaxID=50421 RepID=UPI002846FD1D|nr:hypothetical protein [Rhodoferax sp.]MDR3368225.1 hypothetical protein [Rhodoferax sp.]
MNATWFMPACAVCVGKLCLELFIVLTAREVMGCEAVAGMCARLRTHFLLLRQKKVSKEKATPLSATLRCATGNLRRGLEAGNRSNSLRSDNRGSFSRPKPTAQAHTEGTQSIPLVALRVTLHRLIRLNAVSDSVQVELVEAIRPFDQYRASSQRCNARRSRASSAAPHAVVRRRVAQGWADQGTRLFEAIAEFERPPAQTEQRSEPARSDGDAFGSPSLCLLSLGEARESESPAGARPGLPPHQKQQKRPVAAMNIAQIATSLIAIKGTFKNARRLSS